MVWIALVVGYFAVAVPFAMLWGRLIALQYQDESVDEQTAA